ncbi:BQ5605_C007g04852 [Microbotryum silenes-dioicae]|uniref:BQ5605_C007g04852 protein n=1 Tax=Microbotryum silenes-dioicae TaxID=796604 RepID=A0A2X0PAI0_9BASI|nr:BQ5605_C007g04852 [Microbotryum silenes-dioicae]
MKILITGLLALLITSKVNAQNLDKNMTSIPNCWKAGKDGGFNFQRTRFLFPQDGLDQLSTLHHGLLYVPSSVRR